MLVFQLSSIIEKNITLWLNSLLVLTNIQMNIKVHLIIQKSILKCLMFVLGSQDIDYESYKEWLKMLMNITNNKIEKDKELNDE